MLKLWGRQSSGRTQKVLWTLAEIGLEFEFILASAEMGPAGHVSKGNTPFGVTLYASFGSDARLLAVAAAAERAISPSVSIIRNT